MRTALLLRRLPTNKYSLASLLAAVDLWFKRSGLTPPLTLIVNNAEELLDATRSLVSKGVRVVAAYSFMTTDLPQILNAISEELSALHKLGGIAVAGGPHASGDPLGTLLLGFDYVVTGEGEEVLPMLLHAFEEEVYSKRIPGLAFIDEGLPCYTGRAPPVNLDLYPNFPYWRGLYAPIELTRGCIFACRFCQVSFMQGGRPRHRSLESVALLAEESLKAGRRDLRFITPNAFSYLGDGSRINIDGICALLDRLEGLVQRYGGRIFLGSFPSEVRPEHAAIEEAVRCISGRVANRRVIVGAQSGSERVLRLMNRGHGVEEVVAAVETLNRHGFTADVDIIIGFPGEEREDLEETVRLCELITSKYNARIHAHYYLPLPGTPISGLKPEKPPEDILRRLYKLLGKGLLYGDWLKQYELSWRLVELYEKNVIIGLRGYRRLKRCSEAPLRPYPSSPSASL